MKVRNIHIKLFASFLLILIAMQVYFFIDLNYSAKRQLSPERDQNRVIRILMLKELIEENIRLNNGFESARKELQAILIRTSSLYEAKIWIEDAAGTPLMESFSPENWPEKLPSDTFRMTKRDGVTIHHFLVNNIKMFHTDVPLDSVTGDELSLHIFYESERSYYLSQFTIGLAGILLIMAILALSVLFFFRIKVNRFKESVLRIADGNLHHRVVVDGKGVVEDLGRAFNSMTDKLEKMINSSKEITANVSHEIRTPLARIRVLEDLLRKKTRRGDFSEFERHLDNIRDDIQILDDLVGRLLEFVRLDRYESIPKTEQFDPSEMINDLLFRFEPVIEFKQLEIRKDMLPSVSFTGDRSALASAYLNILDNAIKYTSEQGIITIKMHSENNFIQTSIINSFKSVDQKDLDSIFNPFERLRQSEGGGSGLGLAISKKIVEKHGGDIVALNAPEGFEIRIRLPLEDAKPTT